MVSIGIHSRAHLTLVGAGPGDIDLITLKGLGAIQQADVILYDDLVTVELLKHALPGTLCQAVGKRAGQPSWAQEKINQLCVAMAHQYGHVVRLKGGDPFVFGRGYEEIAYARQHNLPTSVVPGISSCIAVPALQGIPVTSRGVSQSFWVITGTTRHQQLADDLRLAAQSNATVVLLMGLNKLDEICALYDSFGRGNLPMAVIQNGSRPTERCLVGQVWEMPGLVAQYQLGAPAIIIIGEVVRLHPTYMMDYARALSMADRV
ncbi:uroporphyrinogen-III C-methyltransferase [Fibrella arboris]|uniref:uroporphyrinogen-III C-methyltransferase n=1 Tax=Fibrella arboris TaxID=3242486 RepID=UPI003522054C